MTRFCGEVGFGESIEEPSGSGVWEDVITEFTYFGDVIRNSRMLREGVSVNDNITVNNSISIVADAYAREHFFNIRYVKWAGVLWLVTEVEAKSPRLILNLGGVYNGPTA